MSFHIDDDDLPAGRILSRREAISILGSAPPALWLAACSATPEATPGQSAVATTCTAKPELTEGPYYVDTNLNRSDLRPDAGTVQVKTGVPLELTFNVSRLSGTSCTPLANALVDVWQCDALGAYSGVNDPQFGNTLGQTWLRGYQLTGAGGTARFTTIFPGWYPGRATHIHFSIRANESGRAGYHFTSQLFFPEELITEVYTTMAPYTEKGDTGRLRNARDRIFNQGGSQLLLNPVQNGAGYAATFNIGLVV